LVKEGLLEKCLHMVKKDDIYLRCAAIELIKEIVVCPEHYNSDVFVALNGVEILEEMCLSCKRPEII
jgi:hypothetical protein